MNIYTAGWSPAPTDAIIGPDGNLWTVNGTSDIFKFDITAFTTTSYTVTGANALIGIQTDGTYLYASDENATTVPYTAVFKITTAGVSSIFYNASAPDNVGSMYFDGTYLWVASHNAFRQFDLTGTLINSYGGLGTVPLGRLLTDGTYWFAGSNSGVMKRTPVASPGTWTSITFGGGFTFPSVIVGGLVWSGGVDGNIYSIVPATGAVTTYTPSPAPASPQSIQGCYDGKSLWWTFEVGGVWQTTPVAPASGLNYSVGVLAATIVYDAATKMIWATGATGPSQGRAYSFNPTSMRLVMSP